MGKIEIASAAPRERKELFAELESQLLRSLAEQSEQATNSEVCLSARTANGDLVGGLFGSTSYGWLLVKLLWVHEHYRHMGIGRTLMHRAEEQARSVGCHSAWLDTSNPKARTYYFKLGYEEFGRLSNAPGHAPVSHHRWFMKKTL